MKQKELSRWLRVLDGLCLAVVVLLAAVVVPSLADEGAAAYPQAAVLEWPCLIGFWVEAVLALAALALAWQIFAAIGRDESFCLENARRLRAISYLAAADTALTAVGAVVLFVHNALHPAVLLLFFAVMLFGAAAAVACAALSHLTAKAAALKSENDLTI